MYTAILRKVVTKNVHATITKGNMGYDQYTVPDTIAIKPTFVAFLSFSTRKGMSVAFHAILSNFFEKQCPQNHPQYLSGLSGALFPTTFSENSCIKIQLNLHYVTSLRVLAA